MESLLFEPHPHTKKSRKKLEGEKKTSGKCILQEKIHGEINGLKKSHAYNKIITQPFPPTSLPPAPSEVKWLACVQTSFIEENPCSSILARETTPESNHLILSFWLFSFGTFDCSTSHLIGHSKNSSACFKISLPIFHAKRTCFQGILTKVH